jgi:16S rRNA (cytosine967-C5)-methyltransferase
LSAPNPRRDAFEILRRVEEAGAYASILLERRAAAYGDPRDAGLLTELVLGVLRRRSALDHAVMGASSRPLAEIDRAVLTALRLGAYALLFLDRVPDFAAVDTAVSLVRAAGRNRAAGFANGVLRKIAREGRALLPVEPAQGDLEGLALARSHPLWWVRRQAALRGPIAAAALLEADNQPAATVLAPVLRISSGAVLAATLAREGVSVEPCRFVPSALRVVAGVPQRTSAFREGAFWIQDEASQLTVAMLGPAIGPRVADLCAAPGGKTLGLAARVSRGGIVVAADRSLGRLKRAASAFARVHVAGVACVVADLTRFPGTLAGEFDDVLVDAPCSGTGTFRRHPEIRWRLVAADLAALAARQSSLLDAAASLVAPGGRIVYSVCSMEPEEGEQVIEAFLTRQPAFRRVDPRPFLAEPARSLVGADDALRTSPLDDGLDGFFAVVLTRGSDDGRMAIHGGNA